jgi:hypothetical protein
MQILAAPAVAVALLAPQLFAQNVLTVEPGGAFSQIHAAVAAAQDGDVIRVRAGTYSAFDVVGKSLTIVGEPGAAVFYFSFGSAFPPNQALEVRDLAAHQRLVVRDIDFTLSYVDPIPSVLVQNCAGAVVFEDCVISSGFGPGAQIAGAASTTFVRCELRSAGPFKPVGSSTYQTNAGMAVNASSVYLFDCLVVGSKGVDITLLSPATTDGGVGVALDGGLVFAQGSIVSGGEGGGIAAPPLPALCGPAGDGGVGLVMSESFAPARFVAFDTEILGGVGGDVAPGCAFPPGSDGIAQIVNAGTLTSPSGERRTSGTCGLVHAGDAIELLFVGEPGDLAFLAVSLDARGGTFIETLVLAPHVNPAAYVLLPIGLLDASGVSIVTAFAPRPALGQSSQVFTTQAVFVDVFGTLRLGAPSYLTVLAPGV